MRGIRLLAAVAVLSFGSVLCAQGGPAGGGISVPGSSLYSVNIVDTTAQLGGTVDVPVEVDTSAPTIFVLLEVQNDPNQLQLTDFTIGASLQQHIDDNGAPPSCDVFIYPDGSGISLIMFFAVPFDSTIYGNEYIDLNYNVVATQPGQTEITILDIHNPDPVTGTVTIVDEVPVVRGDVDQDGSCNLSDAIKLLGYLFQGDSLCMDAADLDDGGSVNMGDAISLLNALFGVAPPLNETCEPDLQPDTLPDCTGPSC